MLRAFSLVLLGGCIPTAATYLDDVQRTTCTRYAECEPESFAAEYENLPACWADSDSDIADATACAIEHCEDFDAGKAVEALDRIRTVDCSDLTGTTLSALDDPFSGCNGFALALCLGGA